VSTTGLSTFAGACERATGVACLRRLARGFLVERGVRRISYHPIEPLGPGPPVIVAEGFPEDWVRHYLERDLAGVDPITALSARRAHPFLWSEVAALARLAPAERDYLDQLEAAELGDGLAMQVYGPGLRNAYVGLGFGPGGDPPGPAEAFELKAAVQIAHLRLCELTDARAARAADLSPREREVLGWIARGKSNGVIAEIMGVSRHTVDTMIRRIFEKLGVADRTSAVLRGVGEGMVLLHRPPESRGRVT
jgi:LuxR family transcriptional regulator/LuxR family quorum-sensing system transcriptional regulator CciR